VTGALGLLAVVVGVLLYAYGTTADYTWVAFGTADTVPPPRPLSLQALRVLGILLTVAGLVGAVVAGRRRVRPRISVKP
jgi:hypothetical protein